MINNVLCSIYSRSILFTDKEKKKLSRGGVTYESSYLSTKLKVLFVLKDPGVTGSWSFPYEMRKQIKRVNDKGSFGDGWHKTARPLGIWSYAIQNSFPPYQKANKNATAVEGLRYIGLTNLNKLPGASNKTDVGELTKAVVKTRELIKTELEIMGPDIVVCCGKNTVYDLLVSNRIVIPQ